MAEPKTIAVPGADRAWKADPHVGPTSLIGPGEKWLVDGLDWSWAFVVYRDARDFPNYCLGSNGTVWSRARRKSGCLSARWVAIRPFRRSPRNPEYGGYCYFSPSRDGKQYPTGVHRLVAEAFYGPCPPGLECRHLDGNPENNNAYNLKWGTHRENSEDTVRHGRTRKGSKHQAAVLCEADIPVIFRMHKEGVTVTQIAKDHGVSTRTILDAIEGVTWSHVVVPDLGDVPCRYGEDYRAAGRARQLHLRRGGSINPNPKEKNGIHNGPLRTIVEILSRGKCMFDRNHVRLECGHEGYTSLSAKRGRCRQCKAMLMQAGTPWVPVPKKRSIPSEAL